MGLSKTTKLYIQLTLSVILFFTELIVGYWVGSIALVADAFHMLNDVVSLVIAVYAVKLSENTKYDPNYTYGLQRAEVLGALINAVLLLGLCLTIVAEAIPRFFKPVEIENPELILVVGSIGLVFNISGMFLFGHHHSHGECSHSHNHNESHAHEHSHSIEDGTDYTLNHQTNILSPATFQQSIIDTAKQVSHAHQLEINESSYLLQRNQSNDYQSQKNHNHDHTHDHSNEKEGQLNMQGVYLHVLGDALASIAVIISALIIWKCEFPERYLFDPLISIIITLLIVKFTLPLIKSASIILLQGVPSTVPIENVRLQVADIEGVVSIHDLHVWQLSDSKSIASIHVVIDSPHHKRFQSIATEIKRILHSYGVHSVTIQPEFENDSSNSSTSSSPKLTVSSGPTIRDSTCLLPCQAQCAPIQCCPPNP
ncbi:cation efflux protein [Neoconidiobolus thromboides FSU 785]|nr:cation efflux protein [Neoconidiobolus thromboides FSU 785]